MTPECAEQFQNNAREVKLERVRVVEVDDDASEYAKCEYCGKKDSIKEIVRNWGICRKCVMFGNV